MRPWQSGAIGHPRGEHPRVLPSYEVLLRLAQQAEGDDLECHDARGSVTLFGDDQRRREPQTGLPFRASGFPIASALLPLPIIDAGNDVA